MGLPAIFDPLTGLLSHFSWLASFRGSILLLAGGLFLVGVLMLMLLIQSAVFGTPPAPPPVPRSVRLGPARPLAKLADGREQEILRDAGDPSRVRRLAALAGQAAEPVVFDDVLDAFLACGLGEPSVIVTESRRKVIRVLETRTCATAVRQGGKSPPRIPRAGGSGGRDAARGACRYEAGFLAGGFGRLARSPVSVREIACALDGDAACDFEVSY
ncbi:MAG: V4R domain-containing protein [Thermoplasmatota archaeon]